MMSGGPRRHTQPPEKVVLIKLGGAAITHKTQVETLNEQVLTACASQLAQLYNSWALQLVIIHGAGSFGHQTAAASGVAAGGIHGSAVVQHGFAATRASVTKLNGLVVAALIRAGVPAVGLSPCGSWTTKSRRISTDGCQAVDSLLAAGLVPVLHGDAVLDEDLGCTILSGDLIISRLCEHMQASLVVFLTNVDGIFDRPPEHPDAQLIRRLIVDQGHPDSITSQDSSVTGSSLVVTAYTGNGAVLQSISTNIAAHDTTGGVVTKIVEAAAVARLGAEVRIARAGSHAAWAACSVSMLPDDWTGTVIQFSGNLAR